MVMVASGVISVIFGLVLVSLPGAVTLTLVWVVGIYATAVGVVSVHRLLLPTPAAGTEEKRERPGSLRVRVPGLCGDSFAWGSDGASSVPRRSRRIVGERLADHSVVVRSDYIPRIQEV